MPERRERSSCRYSTSVGCRVCFLCGVGALVVPGAAWAAAASQQDDGSPLGILLLLPLAILCYTALLLVLWVLAPAPLLATARLIERGRGRCLLAGLAATLLGLGLISWFSQHKGPGELAGALVLGCLVLAALVGLAAVTPLLGRAVMEMAGRAPSRAGSVAAGSLLLGLAVLFPLVGQVLGIYFLLIGLGGALLALLQTPGRSE